MRHFVDPFSGEIVELQDSNGWEIPDPTPVALPSGMKRPETLAEQVKRLVRSQQFQDDLDKAGLETFDDADDFDVDDDFDPSTPFETFFDPVLNRDITPMEFTQHAETYKKRYVKAQQEYYDKVDSDNVIAENLSRRAHKARQAPKSGGEGDGSPSEGSPAAGAPKPA